MAQTFFTSGNALPLLASCKPASNTETSSLNTIAPQLEGRLLVDPIGSIQKITISRLPQWLDPASKQHANNRSEVNASSCAHFVSKYWYAGSSVPRFEH